MNRPTIKLCLNALLASVLVASAPNADACTDSAVSRLELSAVIASDAYATRYPSTGDYLSAWLRKIERVPGKGATYRVLTTKVNGSDPVGFEVHVKTVLPNHCAIGNASSRLDSVKRIASIPLPPPKATELYARTSAGGGHSDGAGAPCGPMAAELEFFAILQSEKLKLAYGAPSDYLDSIIQSIQGIAPHTYRLVSSDADGSNRREFEIHVADGGCYTDWATVDSVKPIP